MLNGEEVEETDVAGFDADSQTFVCANIAPDQMLQVFQRLALLHIVKCFSVSPCCTLRHSVARFTSVL